MKKMGLEQHLEGALGQSLRIMPLFDGETLKLRVSFQANVNTCEVVVDKSIELGGDVLKNTLKTLVGSIANSKGACLVDRALTVPENWLDDREISFAGVTAKLDLENKSIAKISKIFENNGAIELEATVNGSWLDACEIPPDKQRISGIEVSKNVDILLEKMTPEERGILGGILVCRLETLIGFKDIVLVTNAEVGANIVSAEFTLQNLPYLGTVPLGRIDFNDLGEKSENQVFSAFTKALSAKLEAELAKRIKESSEPTTLDLAGMGKLMFRKKNPVSFLNIERPKDLTIALNGELAVRGFTLPVTININVQSGNVSVDVPNEELAKVAQGKLLSFLSSYLPDLPGGGGIKVDPLTFGPLDDRNLSWGLVLGIEAKFAIGVYPFAFAVDRVTITEDSIRLPQQITLGVSTPIVLPGPAPIILSKLLLTYYTEESSSWTGRWYRYDNL